MSKLISIITPSWNRVQSLTNIPSVLMQLDASMFEWIVGDDGSSDGTLDYIQGHMKGWLFSVKVISSNVRVGKSVIDNMLIQLSDGDFIMWCDSDDLIIPSSFEKLVKSLKKLPNICSGVVMPACEKDGNIIGSWSGLRSNPIIKRCHLSSYCNFTNKVDASIIFRSSCIKQHKFPEVDFYCPESSVFTYSRNSYFKILTSPLIRKTYEAKGAITNTQLIQYPLGYSHSEAIQLLNTSQSLISTIRQIKSFSLYALLARTCPLKVALSNSLKWWVILATIALLPSALISLFIVKYHKKMKISASHMKFQANLKRAMFCLCCNH